MSSVTAAPVASAGKDADEEEQLRLCPAAHRHAAACAVSAVSAERHTTAWLPLWQLGAAVLDAVQRILGAPSQGPDRCERRRSYSFRQQLYRRACPLRRQLLGRCGVNRRLLLLLLHGCDVLQLVAGLLLPHATVRLLLLQRQGTAV